MAAQRKTETIHVRVTPSSKALLEGLANHSHTNVTKVIENLIQEAARKTTSSDASLFVRPELHGINLKTAVEKASASNPIIEKLRLFMLFPFALSSNDRYMALAILNDDMFAGGTAVFEEPEKVTDDGVELPSVSLEKVEEHREALLEYAEFRTNNPRIKADFSEFLKMSND